MYKDAQILAIIKRAKKVGVTLIVNNGVNSKTNRRTITLAKKYPEVKASLGIYPIDGLKLSASELKKELSFIESQNENIIAIGEVGMDFKMDKTSDGHKRQEKLFRSFISLAKKLDKPIIIHSRKAEAECIQVLEDENPRKVVMHCFSGKVPLIKRIIENGWTLTAPTCVKHAEQFQNLIRLAPINQLLCETDSPFLHPDKKRNNEPANVIESYKKIAEIKGMSIKKVEAAIEANFKKLFGN